MPVPYVTVWALSEVVFIFAFAGQWAFTQIHYRKLSNASPCALASKESWEFSPNYLTLGSVMLTQNKDSVLYLHSGSEQLPSPSLWTICLKETQNPWEASLQSAVRSLKTQAGSDDPALCTQPCNGSCLCCKGGEVWPWHPSLIASLLLARILQFSFCHHIYIVLTSAARYTLAIILSRS